MKIILIIFLSILLIALCYFIYLGYKSQTGTANGLIDGKLTACSAKPNCICTEFPNNKTHYTKPITYTSLDLENIVKAIESTGGVITENKNNYISASYSSSLFRYIDDFEIRIDETEKLIHIRSASRVGHSDMGANTKRIEQFKKLLSENKDAKSQLSR